MRRVLPFLFMVLFANALFAQTSQEKSAKYGTRPLADNPEPYLFINPDYTQSFRSTDVLVNMGGGSWISETSWSIVDAELALMLQRLIQNGDAVPEHLKTYALQQWQRPSVQKWLALRHN